MKKNLRTALFLICTISFFEAKSQWCIPLTAIPYDANMPGITHFVLNTIDRTSLALEHYPNNSYVNTGLSTDLIKGSTYSVSMTYNIDATICPTMNLRVWIDYNVDGQLDDVGETVLSADNQLPGTYTGSFTVPVTATPGITRLRATAKMSQSGGHTLPNPCDNPADPLGYHGEIEDYTINIVDVAGINSPSSSDDFRVTNSGRNINFSFSLKNNSETELAIFDLQGKKVKEILPSQNLSAGKYSFDLISGESEINAGIYFAAFSSNGSRLVKKVLIE